MAEKQNTPFVETVFNETKYTDWFQLGMQGVSTFLNSKVEYSNQLLQSNNYELSAANNQTNAQRLLFNNEIINRNTQEQLNKVLFEKEKLKGKQVEIESASGFEVGSRSFIDMQNQSDYLASQTVAALTAQNAIEIAKNDYQREVLKLQAASDMMHAKSQLKIAKATKKYGAISGALQFTSGLAGGLGKYSQGNQTQTKTQTKGK